MSWLSCLSNGVADTEADRRFDELVNANASQWISLARQIANDAHYAEDAVVEALAALSAALASAAPPRDPAAWMKAAIANRARNRIRDEISQCRAIERLGQVSPAPSSRPPESPADAAPELRELQFRQIESIIPRLAPRQREVVELRMIEGLTHREIAERLQCAESSVRTTYRAAIQKLRGWVEFEDDSAGESG